MIYHRSDSVFPARSFLQKVFVLCLFVLTTAAIRSATPSSPVDTILFGDPVLEIRVREAMGKTTGELTSNHAKVPQKLILDNLTRKRDNITNIGALKYFTGLKSLDLTNNKIEDITPLSGLKGLTELELGGNLMSSLDALKDLSQLKILRLFYSPISDLSALSNLPIEELNVGRCPVTDLTPLRGKQCLTLLWLNLNKYADTVVIKSLTNLKTLAVSYCALNNLEFVKGLTHLEHLLAEGNTISDLSPLASMTHLTTLYLDNTHIQDLSVLEKLYRNGCFGGYKKFKYHISVQDCNLDLMPGSNNRRIVDYLIKNGVVVAWQKGNKIE
jgi:internalin A